MSFTIGQDGSSLLKTSTPHNGGKRCKEKEEEGMPGVIIGGININNLRYADDTGLLAIDLSPNYVIPV